MRCLINWMVHLTALTSALRLHGAGSNRLVIGIVVLQVHCVSTHSWLGLVCLEMSIKLIILLRLVARGRRHVVLLMISAGWKLPDWLTGVLPIIGIVILWLFSLQIIVGQVTYLVLVLLMLVLGRTRSTIMNILTAYYVVSVLNIILAARGVGRVLRRRPNIRLLSFSLDILAIRMTWYVLNMGSLPIVIKRVLVLLLVWVLSSGREWHLLR